MSSCWSCRALATYSRTTQTTHSGRLQPDPEIAIDLDLEIAAELALVPRDRLAGVLPAALLLALLGLGPEEHRLAR